MSNVNFSFGTDLLGNFVAGNGVYVYATVFAGGTWVNTFKLVNNGTVSGSLTDLLLPDSLISGNIVITMQEAGTASPFDPTNKPLNQVALISAAAANNYRYDAIELTLSNSPGDAANLSFAPDWQRAQSIVPEPTSFLGALTLAIVSQRRRRPTQA